MKFIKNLIAISIIGTTSIFALSVSDLEKMPKSIERDFFIWRFISKTQNKEDILKASKLIYRVNKKLDSAFFKKIGTHLPKKVYKVKDEEISKYKQLFAQIKKSNTLFEGWIELSPKDKLLFFNLCGRENRKLLNKEINSNVYLKLTKYKKINQFIYRVIKEDLNNLLNTILANKPINQNRISYANLLKLGFLNLKRDRAKEASNFFYNAIFKAKSRFDADRAIFWTFMANRKRKFLLKVANSYDFNIYKLIALDFLNLPYPKPATAKVDNKDINFNITDPIEWAKLKQKIFSKSINLYKLALKFNSISSLSYYYYILNKASRNKKQYFPIPYKNILKNYPIKRQALILAIARQESHFIPASISSSFAVGMMQFMPFLVKHIAKVRGEKVELEDMFKPEISIKFANTHLDYLEKYLYNPLFIAYAYNAGIGYTRRLIRKDIFKPGKYEPYLSMELVDNTQANHYGKKVLANYVIYRMLLGSPVKITDIIKELTVPTLTDRFR